MRSDDQAKTFGPGSTCDSCSSAPLVAFKKESSDFFFCGHHANKNELSLIENGYAIVADFRAASQKFHSTGSGEPGRGPAEVARV